MKFRTEINIPEYPFNLQIEPPIVFWGSCFSANVGALLQNHFFDVTINPFGVVFNPLSINNQIESVLKNKLDEEMTFEKNGKYFSFQFSTKYSASSLDGFKKKAQNTFHEVGAKIENAQVLFITLGTSWVYDYNVNSKTVANCHKIPQKAFSKRLLSVNEILEAMQNTLNLVLTYNPKLKVVFTVSPVRHVKEGLVNNAVSKARLLDAVYQITQSNSQAYYFPAYEIFLDDLRDYRFFDDDLIHPNQQGVNYVWELFTKAFISDLEKPLLQKLNSYFQASQHKSIKNDPEEFEKHSAYLANTKRELLSVAPFLKHRL